MATISCPAVILLLGVNFQGCNYPFGVSMGGNESLLPPNRYSDYLRIIFSLHPVFICFWVSPLLWASARHPPCRPGVQTLQGCFKDYKRKTPNWPGSDSEFGILFCLLVSADLPNVRQVSNPLGIFCLVFSFGRKPGFWNDRILPKTFNLI